MRTETQIAATRANRAKSRGRATTTAGRAISAQELAGAKLIVIEGESTDRWQAFLEASHREFQSQTEIAAAPGAAGR
jgi:hypothetical protein